MKKLVSIVSVLPILLFAGCSSGTPSPVEASPDLSSFLEIVPSDPFSEDAYSLRVIVGVTNTSQESVDVTCVVESLDANNELVAPPFEVSTDVALNPSEHDLLVADIPVSKGNASDATESGVKCVSTKAEAVTWPLVVSDVSNCSLYDEETKQSYWYGCFKVKDVEPLTKIDCKMLALSKSGNLILVQRFTGNVLMDNSVTPFGLQSEDSVMPTARKDFVDAINSFEIKCRMPA
jgi:hypothetical protein